MGIDGIEELKPDPKPATATNPFEATKDVRELIFQLGGAVSTCWENVSAAGVFWSEEASKYCDQALERLGELEPLVTAVLSEDETVIQHKGTNYYKMCGEKVTGEDRGTITHCVKRINHPGVVHEDFDGNMRAIQRESTKET